ncbi:hypothetical protein JI435_402600 [Parastagonospora nodorum SN15]|uniref:Uncharacterized protein n=1 Tax=Phaeosphaeria nodorum (strain SN15 / ATCC MYA-4574 / FGSC 10173) TaxID=321614 RepID=A0A7U2ETI7_PHANO|nr:hypothetical protein JI435_402600 [Parastagonospora nodorum SN15]
MRLREHHVSRRENLSRGSAVNVYDRFCLQQSEVQASQKFLKASECK